MASDVLLYTSMPVANNVDCEAALRFFEYPHVPTTDNEICAGTFPNPRDACQVSNIITNKDQIQDREDNDHDRKSYHSMFAHAKKSMQPVLISLPKLCLHQLVAGRLRWAFDGTKK